MSPRSIAFGLKEKALIIKGVLPAMLGKETRESILF